jgi:hypothetical protein
MSSLSEEFSQSQNIYGIKKENIRIMAQFVHRLPFKFEADPLRQCISELQQEEFSEKIK